MKTRLFTISVLTLGLVTLGAVVSFADVDTSATISATVGPAESVAMPNLAFGSLTVGYTKAVSSVTFNSNYGSNVLRIWTDNSPEGPGMVSGTNTIPLKYFFSETGASALTDPITETSWGTEWTEVSNVPATPSGLFSNEEPIDKSTAGDATLDFATKIESTTQEGSYSTVLQLELVHP